MQLSRLSLISQNPCVGMVLQYMAAWQSSVNSLQHWFLLSAQVNSEFQAYKHIECMEPGELMRASSPLEAIIGMHPTLILTNALPYDISVTVWQVAACPLI